MGTPGKRALTDRLVQRRPSSGEQPRRSNGDGGAASIWPEASGTVGEVAAGAAATAREEVDTDAVATNGLDELMRIARAVRQRLGESEEYPGRESDQVLADVLGSELDTWLDDFDRELLLSVPEVHLSLEEALRADNTRFNSAHVLYVLIDPGNKGFETPRTMTATIRTRAAHVSTVAFDASTKDHEFVLGRYYPNGNQESAEAYQRERNQGVAESEGLGLIDWILGAAAVRGIVIALARRIAARLAQRAAARLPRLIGRPATSSAPKGSRDAPKGTGDPAVASSARAEAGAADDAASSTSSAAKAAPDSATGPADDALPDAATLLGNATRPFKDGRLTEAGRALTKHPEVVGQTKATLRTALATEAEINAAAETALAGILGGQRTVVTLPRYGSVIQYTGPSGFGARFRAETGDFIGFINP